MGHTELLLLPCNISPCGASSPSHGDSLPPSPTIHGLGPAADVLVQFLQLLGELLRLFDHLDIPCVAGRLPFLVIARAESQRLLHLQKIAKVQGRWRWSSIEGSRPPIVNGNRL